MNTAFMHAVKVGNGVLAKQRPRLLQLLRPPKNKVHSPISCFIFILAHIGRTD